MRGVKGGGALILAVGALAGVQAQSAQAKLTPGQTRLEEDRKKLYAVELEHDKDVVKFQTANAKEAAKVSAKAAKDREQAALDRRIASKINDEIGKSGGAPSEAKIEKLRKEQAAYEAKAALLELEAEEAELQEAKSGAKRTAVLAALVPQRAALEAQIIEDEEAVEAEESLTLRARQSADAVVRAAPLVSAFEAKASPDRRGARRDCGAVALLGWRRRKPRGSTASRVVDVEGVGVVPIPAKATAAQASAVYREGQAKALSDGQAKAQFIAEREGVALGVPVTTVEDGGSIECSGWVEGEGFSRYLAYEGEQPDFGVARLTSSGSASATPGVMGAAAPAKSQVAHRPKGKRKRGTAKKAAATAPSCNLTAELTLAYAAS